MIYVIWLFWLISAVLVVVAIVAKIYGDAVGGWLSNIIPGGVFAAATLMMLFAGTTPSGQPIVSGLAGVFDTAGSAEARLRDAKEREKALAKQLAETREEEARLSRAATKPFSAQTPPKAVATPPSEERQATLFVVLLAFIALDVGVLLYAAGLPLLTMFKKDAKRDEQLARLEELTKLVWNEDYRGALAKAADILELKLRKPELLDLLYLRSYAAIQVTAFPQPNETQDYRTDILHGAIKALEAVIAETPRRGQALYALALAYGLASRHADALAMFERAKPELEGVALVFAHNQSVCLLHEGENHLSQGNIEEAEKCFGRVAVLGELASAVLQVRIKIAMLDLRNAMGKRAIAAAQAVLQKAVAFSGLSSDQKATMEVIGIELNARAALNQGDPDKAAAAAETFLAKYMPAGMPPPTEDVVDEVFPTLLDSDLAFPRQVYRDILLMTSIARALISTRKRVALTENEVARIGEPLLKALQIEPRQRDLLAAIGGLYYWNRRDLRGRAREWLEAAVTMGAESRFVRLILARDRAVEADRRRALDDFRSASARFLRDPSLATEMRRALVEELGRFQEFEPMLIELQEKRDYDPEEPSVAALRERAKYLADLMETSRRRGDSARYGRLETLKSDYERALTALEQSAKSIEALERSVIVELGGALAMV